jgi:hypothetical protein
MATVMLTARYLNQLKSHGKRYQVFDALVPGLAIRISVSGRKTFTLYYRHRGRTRRLGLGRYPDLLLEKARKIATQDRGHIFGGADPVGGAIWADHVNGGALAGGHVMMEDSPQELTTLVRRFLTDAFRQEPRVARQLWARLMRFSLGLSFAASRGRAGVWSCWTRGRAQLDDAYCPRL